ncbi:TIR domain-containing protein [Anthocerotibacter panamensis]|uniref:TIR domain-containing protein n=1 Tax=Anthocerotibacter panamensis TaxID=2857077 RepID=UPI001C40596B|nr:TIR domain-containing protein [Anthocerotibacter panamensis]
MSELHEELLAIADRLEQYPNQAENPDVKAPLDDLEEATMTIGKAWSGSWLGYHARIYYSTLQAPPPGVHFSREWGMMRLYAIQGTTGEWQEFDQDKLEQAIHKLAGNPDLGSARQLAAQAQRAFEDDKPEVLSLLTTAIAEQEDSFLTRLREEADAIQPLTRLEVVRHLQPSGEVWSRDSLAVSQGFHTPPHMSVRAEVIALRQPSDACRELAHIARKAGSHLARKRRQLRKTREIGTNVFIGHGRSPLWKDLKDFIQDRLSLPWDEFNRVPAAGITNIARLSEMLDASAIAFLIMTGEDEQADGRLRARMNVVHEAGLFQGRLGFTRAIVLLEEGCEEFSNIQGLGQIRFPQGNIKAIFEEIRMVLEREGLL